MCFFKPDVGDEPAPDFDDARLLAEAIAIDLLRIFGDSEVLNWAQIERYLAGIMEQTHSNGLGVAGSPLPGGRRLARTSASPSTPDTSAAGSPVNDAGECPDPGPNGQCRECAVDRDACAAQLGDDFRWPLRC